MRGRFHRRRVIVAALGTLALLLAYPAWVQSTYNFGTVRPGAIYRSGQMPARVLTATIRDHGVRTVLNLRGDNPDQPWYSAEREAVLKAGTTLVDIPMSSSEWISRAQLRGVVEVLDTYQRPILIHCRDGMDRTGLVSTIAELLRPGATLDDARRQLSIRYLYVRLGARKVMAEHVDAYDAWLTSRGLTHTPDRFRQWVAQGYVPRRPSREFWRYDPKPPMLVSRPEPSKSTR